MNTLPSWKRWPPNCCETCVGFQPNDPNKYGSKYAGKCNKSDSLECGTTVDTRFRCAAFERKEGI